MCSSFKIALCSHKHSKSERKMKWANPETGSGVLACDRQYPCLQAQVPQKVSQGVWHYPVITSLSFASSVTPSKLHVCVCLHSPRRLICCSSLLCKQGDSSPPSIYSPPWCPDSSLAQRGGWSALPASCETNRCLAFLSAAAPPELTHWPERINSHFILC